MTKVSIQPQKVVLGSSGRDYYESQISVGLILDCGLTFQVMERNTHLVSHCCHSHIIIPHQRFQPGKKRESLRCETCGKGMGVGTIPLEMPIVSDSRFSQFELFNYWISEKLGPLEGFLAATHLELLVGEFKPSSFLKEWDKNWHRAKNYSTLDPLFARGAHKRLRYVGKFQNIDL